MNLVSDREEYRTMARYSRVWFYGEGPDNPLRPEWRPYLDHLLRRRDFGRLAKTAGELVIGSRRIPFLRRLIRPLKSWWSGQSEQSPFPNWLNRDLASRLHLRERWEEIQRFSSMPCPHPFRPQAYRSFEHPLWEYMFSQSDAEAMGVAAEIRHPFADLRMLRYMLAVPAIPWARDKYLIRRAMRKVLPAPVLKRPKTPLTGDPQWEAALRLGLPRLLPQGGLERYVDPTRVPDRADQDMMTFWSDLRPRTLNYWLGNLQSQTPGLENLGSQSEQISTRDRRNNSKRILKTAS